MRIEWSVVLAMACSHPPASRPTSPPPAPAPDPARLDGIPDPPDLPAVPEVNACEPFDLKNPACKNDPRMCDFGYADCKCPSPPSVEYRACWAVMPCPAVPDKRIRACASKFPCDASRPDPDNPNCR